MFLSEHFDDEPKLNPDEVMAYRWVELDDLKKDMEKNPQNYTALVQNNF